MNIIIKGTTILNPEQNINEKTDLIISDGVISKFGNLAESDYKNAKVYEFNNSYCVPGLFDMHVHLREPGREDEETIITGSDSAAAGGFTGVACMPNTNPAIDTAEVVKFIKEKSQQHLVEVFPIAAATQERKGEGLSPMIELFEAGAIGFSDDGNAIKSASLLRNAFEYVKMFDSVIIEHCEDESFADGAMNEGIISTSLGLPPIPSIAEDIIVMRDIITAEYSNGKIHIAHISSKNAIELVRQAKKKGINITAEATPHHFTLTEESLKSYDTNYKMNPPLRTKEDVDAVIEGLKDGTIDCIASDHAPHSIEEKEYEFIYAPNGIIGLETTLGLTLTELYHKKHLNIVQIIEKLSINPRKILKIPTPQIKEGEKANLTIFDPNSIWTVDISKFKSKCKNSPFNNKLLTGKMLAVINKNKMLFEDKFIHI
ncbi:MAG: dihydroorotase [Ignavibacteriales bacterium]|nr:dihydroorotase [Ignavibacteriales bacterium]